MAGHCPVLAKSGTRRTEAETPERSAEWTGVRNVFTLCFIADRFPVANPHGLATAQGRLGLVAALRTGHRPSAGPDGIFRQQPRAGNLGQERKLANGSFSSAAGPTR
jgi:hypothetical protein